MQHAILLPCSNGNWDNRTALTLFKHIRHHEQFSLLDSKELVRIKYALGNRSVPGLLSNRL